jgi:hypothetical protein
MGSVDCALKMMDSALKLMNSALKLMNSATGRLRCLEKRG